MKRLFIAAAAAALLAAPVAAQDWTLDADASTVRAVVSVFNAEVVADFSRFEAAVALDPDNLETASIEAVVYAASGVIANNSDYQNALTGASGLEVSQYETITFTSRDITRSGDGYAAEGALSIKDMTRDVTLLFTLEIEHGRALAVGGFTLDRVDLGMTSSSWDDNVGEQVRVELAIAADAGE